MISKKFFVSSCFIFCFFGLLKAQIGSPYEISIKNGGIENIGAGGKQGSYSGIAIESGGILNNSGIHDMGFDLFNDGTFESFAGAEDSMVGGFDYTRPQVIEGSSTSKFYDVILRNGGTDIYTKTDVKNNVNFMKGLVTTVHASADNGALRLYDNATASGTITDAVHVDGYVTKIGNDAFTFPVGSAADYRFLSISAPANPTSELSVAYYPFDPDDPIDPTGGAHNTLSLTSPLISVGNTFFWDVVTVNTPMVVTVTISLPDITSLYGPTADVRMVGWNTAGSAWEILGPANPTSTAEGGTITNAGIDISQYSAITIGSLDFLLPVELLSFNAEKYFDARSLCTWTTLSEHGTGHFEVERMNNQNNNWEVFGQVEAAGNSITQKNYQYIDQLPQAGKNYYRLKSVDQDNQFNYSVVRMVEFDGSGNSVLVSFYPNPIYQNEAATINIQHYEGMCMLHVYDELGRLVLSKSFSKHVNFALAGGTASAHYYAEIRDENNELLKTFKFEQYR